MVGPGSSTKHLRTQLHVRHWTSIPRSSPRFSVISRHTLHDVVSLRGNTPSPARSICSSSFCQNTLRRESKAHERAGLLLPVLSKNTPFCTFMAKRARIPSSVCSKMTPATSLRGRSRISLIFQTPYNPCVVQTSCFQLSTACSESSKQ